MVNENMLNENEIARIEEEATRTHTAAEKGKGKMETSPEKVASTSGSVQRININKNDAQVWLDAKYPHLLNRSSVTSIGETGGGVFEAISIVSVPNALTGKFTNFKGFDNLTEIYLPWRKISVDSVYAFPVSLRRLQLSCNGFNSTLEPFSHLVNLEWLDLGWMAVKLFAPDRNYNKFYGSLKYLQDLNKLEWICLGTTNVDSGIEFLSDTVTYLGLDSVHPNMKCLDLKKEFAEFNYNVELYKMWKLRFINYERLTAILNSDNLSIAKKERVHSITQKFLSLASELVSEGKGLVEQNKLLSVRVLDLEKDLNFYKDSQRKAVLAVQTKLPLLMNLGESSNNVVFRPQDIGQLKTSVIALQKEIEEKNHELTKSSKLADENKKSLMVRGFQINFLRGKVKKLAFAQESKDKLEIEKQALIAKNQELQDKIDSEWWKSKYANVGGRLAGLLVTGTKYTPLPKHWHDKLEAVATAEQIRGVVQETSFVMFMIILIGCYEVFRWLFWKAMGIYYAANSTNNSNSNNSNNSNNNSNNESLDREILRRLLKEDASPKKITPVKKVVQIKKLSK